MGKGKKEGKVVNAKTCFLWEQFEQFNGVSTCKHCKGQFRGNPSAARLTNHLLGIENRGIRVCKDVPADVQETLAGGSISINDNNSISTPAPQQTDTSVNPTTENENLEFTAENDNLDFTTDYDHMEFTTEFGQLDGDGAVASSLPENSPLVVSHEATQGEASNDGNSKLSTDKSEVKGGRKSDRRRSYTSLLMSWSKLIEEHGEFIDRENLQTIDDACNQLEVAEYADEIHQYYWLSEAQNLSLVNYMSIQKDITPQMRRILINWLIEVHFEFELMQETLYLTVTFVDRYLSQVQIKKKELLLVGLTALFLASKYEDCEHLMIKDLISISAEPYTRQLMLGMEKLILKQLKFGLNEPTPYVFMLRFLEAAQSDTKLKHMAFFLIELCLVEYEALKFKPSLLSASAIYVARSTLQLTPPWTPLLAKHASYEVSQIRDCAEMILRFHRAARTAKPRVTFEKFTSPDLSSVAAINPLERLPIIHHFKCVQTVIVEETLC